MARTTEPSEPANSLPRPELNPLVNPLLADNMGRWAEVYFTNPPEKREEAVIELIRELEREQSQAPSTSSSAKQADARQVASFEQPMAFSEEHQLEFVNCGSCGRENPVTHQFCGMCGRKIESENPQREERVFPQRELYPQHDLSDGTVRDGHADDARATPRHDFESVRQDSRIDEPQEDATVRDPSWSYRPQAVSNNELSLFQSLRPADVDERWDDEPPSSSPYRFYIAVVLAIVILGLGYMAWRGAQGTQSSHQVSPPPPSPVVESAPPAAAPSPSANSSDPGQPAAPKTAPEISASNTRPVSHPKVQAPPPRNQLANHPTQPPASPKQAHPETAPSGGGAEELAMAKRYLDGTGGQGRDSSEAAKWLWKSIAKHNGQATLLLADLYLRGDGVSKNCDQGHVLLDSAARSGVPGAGERLRNLQAFGCH